jgi:polysaccharide pyruvyl transferase WcaK-like protein
MLVRDWPAGRPRILVSDAWLANGGDAAIALATDRRLRRLAPEAAILHAAYQGDILAEHVPELALVPPLAGLLGVTPAIPELRGWDPAEGERIVGGADAVLCQGGGYAMEHYDPWERLRAWELVVERGVPIAFGAQTIGPFRREAERAILASVYPAAVAIALREGDSVRHVLDLGARPEQLLVTADEAFGLHSPVGEAGRRGIACVVSRDPQLRADGILADPDTSVEVLAGLVAELVRHGDGEGVTMLSTFQGLGGLGRGVEDDAEVAAEVVAALPPALAASVRTTAGYLAPGRCAELIAGHRGLVTTRMHPAIFGLSLGVPTALVTRAYKATSMFAALGLGHAIVDRADPAAVAARLSTAAPDAAVARERAGWNDALVARLLAAVRG